MESKITLCSNVETLRPIWGDIYDAYFETSHDWDESIASAWSHHLRKGIWDHGADFQYNSSFQYWNGGPGHAPVHVRGEEPDWLRPLIAEADALARTWAQRDIEEMKAATEAEES